MQVFDAAQALERIARERITLLPGPPTIYQMLLAHPERSKYDLSSLRLAVTGAAAVPVELVKRMRSELGFASVITAYGLTETCGVVSMCEPSDDAETIATTSGRALPATEVRCVDEKGGEVPRGTAGEIVVRGYNVMRGYFEDPAETAKAIDAEGWLHTGDQARIEAGHVRIVGRLKEVLILSTAEKIAPADLEMAIAGDPLFEQAMVLGEAKPYLAALIVLSGEAWPGFARSLGVVPGQAGALAAPAVVDAALKRVERRLERFPSYARVRRAWLTLEPWTIESGLITPTMKLKRTELAGRYAREITALYEQDRAAAGPGAEGRLGSGALGESAR
jgi:long-subunit acyl-CoA synthetase (AMP-forming)